MQPELDQHIVESAKIEPYEPPTGTSLFLTNDPDTFLLRASEAATAIARVVRERKLFTTIRGKDHVHIGGWTLCGSLLGVFPITEWTRRIDDGWESRVVAKTRRGETVGAAEAMCLGSESKWRTAEEHAIRSMAATRAASKALRLPLGFIFELEGFDPTPADEVATQESERASDTGRLSPQVQPTREQKRRMRELLEQLSERDPYSDWRARLRELAGVPADKLTQAGADGLIRQLEQELVA
jgi:hypothetical protein